MEITWSRWDSAILVETFYQHSSQYPPSQTLNECHTIGPLPTWLVDRRTTVIMKDILKGRFVGNDRSIACLNLSWKLLAGMISESTYNHLFDKKLLPYEQKGWGRNSQGTKHHLITNKVVLKICT